MLELGKLSIEAHESIGKMIPGIIDILFVVGPRGKFIADAAIKAGMEKKNIHAFDTVGEMQPEVQNMVEKGDLVLIKASRGMGLDRVVEEIREMA